MTDTTDKLPNDPIDESLNFGWTRVRTRSFKGHTLQQATRRTRRETFSTLHGWYARTDNNHRPIPDGVSRRAARWGWTWGDAAPRVNRAAPVKLKALTYADSAKGAPMVGLLLRCAPHPPSSDPRYRRVH
jgi:hypothetical protein